MKNNNEWFGEWFDSAYYHILYKNRNDDEAAMFISNLISTLPIQPNWKILDLACGKGRHSIFLNNKGFDVTGVDLSKNSIDQASTVSNERLRFAVHDMRDPITFGPFDLVLNLFTSFGYFDTEQENASVIHRMYDALVPNGVAVIDYMNASKVANTLVTTESKTIQNIEFDIRRSIQQQHIVKDISFSDHQTNYHFQERVRIISLDTFTQWINEAGLSIKHVWGDYHLNEYQPSTSDRLILCVEKRS